MGKKVWAAVKKSPQFQFENTCKSMGTGCYAFRNVETARKKPHANKQLWSWYVAKGLYFTQGADNKDRLAWYINYMLEIVVSFSAVISERMLSTRNAVLQFLGPSFYCPSLQWCACMRKRGLGEWVEGLSHSGWFKYFVITMNKHSFWQFVTSLHR